MKGLLIFLLLISFIVNKELNCQPNEVLDKQTQRCLKICEKGYAYISETSTCESIIKCPEGMRFNGNFY